MFSLLMQTKGPKSLSLTEFAQMTPTFTNIYFFKFESKMFIVLVEFFTRLMFPPRATQRMKSRLEMALVRAALNLLVWFYL